MAKDLSSFGPPSFMDDGLNFDARCPAGSDAGSGWDIDAWVDNVISSSRVSEAGSGMDDFADVLPSKTPGAPSFGRIDPNFYKPKLQPKLDSAKGNPALKKAICGEINASLERMRKARKIRVVDEKVQMEFEAKKKHRSRKKKTSGHDKDDKKKIEVQEDRWGIPRNTNRDDLPPTPPGAVRIFLPIKAPGFIIHGENGRVVVCEQNGDMWDSAGHLYVQDGELYNRGESLERQQLRSGDNGKHSASGRQKGSSQPKEHNKGRQRERQEKHKRTHREHVQEPTSTQRQPQHQTKTKTEHRKLAAAMGSLSVFDKDPNYFMPGKFPYSEPSSSGSTSSRSSSCGSEDSWMSGAPYKKAVGHKKTSNYRAPTVEEAPEAPMPKQDWEW